MRKHRQRLPFFIIILLIAANLQACGMIQRAIEGIPTPAPTNTPTLSPTPTVTLTLTPTNTPSPTITPNLTATRQYTDFASLIQKIHDAGQISTTQGSYIRLSDYQDEVAGKLSYSWNATGVKAKNFVIQADFEWSNAVRTLNISGCGFVYRLQENRDHYLIFLDAISGVKLASNTDRGTYSMGSPKNGDRKSYDFGPEPYHANFTLVVNDLKTYVYVNDVYRGEYQLLDYRITDSGALADAVLSATDSGYGTRCKMTNVHAWVITP